MTCTESLQYFEDYKERTDETWRIMLDDALSFILDSTQRMDLYMLQRLVRITHKDHVMVNRAFTKFLEQKESDSITHSDIWNVCNIFGKNDSRCEEFARSMLYRKYNNDTYFFSSDDVTDICDVYGIEHLLSDEVMKIYLDRLSINKATPQLSVHYIDNLFDGYTLTKLFCKAKTPTGKCLCNKKHPSNNPKLTTFYKNYWEIRRRSEHIDISISELTDCCWLYGSEHERSDYALRAYFDRLKDQHPIVMCIPELLGRGDKRDEQLVRDALFDMYLREWTEDLNKLITTVNLKDIWEVYTDDSERRASAMQAYLQLQQRSSDLSLDTYELDEIGVLVGKDDDMYARVLQVYNDKRKSHHSVKDCNHCP
ncbi:hypothetical protein CYMTET_46075 [Cymbomonas tetramitiformis]|uniref:Uncharacterized protein n=1 Tax=Cymbomonas tetramitiformis TaxID=36881 RepID=A0AAE0EXY2_9CHLO|nr:hypothetical protein CYMTET_46075 [Cymbomonas tetramitiformis]